MFSILWAGSHNQSMIRHTANDLRQIAQHADPETARSLKEIADAQERELPWLTTINFYRLDN